MADTKMEALAKAQNLQREKYNEGLEWCDIHDCNVKGVDYFEVIWSGMKKTKIEYCEQRPLERDTYIWSPGLRLYLYAVGEFSDFGFNKCYPPGRCSKNIDGFEDFISVEEFEIIERPTDFEKMQTTDDICIQTKCPQYRHKYQRVESEKFLHGTCESCTVLISEPSKYKGVE